MKVSVLYGGPSAEREVSLVSGRAVIEGLRLAGHEVYPSDISPDDLSGLDRPVDVIFPVLHGAFGESGELQEIMERRGLPFVGSGSAASRLGMDKIATKRVWKRAGLPVPRDVLVETGSGAEAALESVGLPCVVKAVDSGSSIDVFICHSESAARKAMDDILSHHGRVMVEQFIQGHELTVGILEQRPLAPIRIVTTREFYDFQAKYQGNYTEYRFDLNLPDDLVQRVRELGRRAHETIGCRDLSRVDLIVDEHHQPHLLEINTLPGFTPRSLLPKAARHGGIEFPHLVDRLVRRAFERARPALAAAG